MIFLFFIWSDEFKLTSSASTFLPQNNANVLVSDGAGGVWYMFSRKSGDHYQLYSYHIDSSFSIITQYEVSRGVIRSQWGGYGTCLMKEDTLIFFWDDIRLDYPEIYERYYILSISGGLASPITEVSTVDGYYSMNPSACLDSSGAVHVVWEDTKDGYPAIYMGPGIPEKISEENFSFFPQAVAAPDGIYILWEEEREDGMEVVMKKKTGEREEKEVVSPEDGVVSYGACATIAPDGKLYVFYVDLEENTRIYWRYKEGNTWSDVISLSSYGVDAFHPHACSDKYGNIHVVWEEKSEDGGAVFYAKIKENAILEKEKINVNTWGCVDPFVMVDVFSKIHVAWSAFDGDSIRFPYYRVYAPEKRRGLTETKFAPLEITCSGRTVLYDIMGRVVMEFAGGNISLVPPSPGVYFLVTPERRIKIVYPGGVK